MAQTLFVGSTTDYSGTLLSPQVTGLTFTNTGVDATALFSAAQVPVQVVNNMAVTGSVGVNTLSFTMSAPGTFTPQFSFSNWSAADKVTVGGSGGADTIRGVSVAETISGGAGNDVIFGSLGADKAYGGGGADTFAYDLQDQAKNDTIDGRDGSDTLFVAAGGFYDFTKTSITRVETLLISQVAGGLAHVNMNGNQIGGVDRINTIQFLDGADATLYIFGNQIDLTEIKVKQWNPDNHSITLSATSGGADIIGTSVRDYVKGSAGDDTLDGGGGRDFIDDSLGIDRQFGGSGDDQFNITLAGSIVAGEVYDGGEGRDVIVLSAPGQDVFDFAGVTIRNVEELILFDGKTAVLDAENFGVGFGIGRVYGENGVVDTLQVNGSSIDMGDVEFDNWENTDFVLLAGTDGDDVINATQARDVIAGQAGADEFAFSDQTFGKNAGRDRINDFGTGSDILNLSGIDANVVDGIDNSFTIVSAFSGVAGQLIIKQNATGNKTILSGDVTGDGKVDMQIEIDGLHSFTPGVDLIL